MAMYTGILGNFTASSGPTPGPWPSPWILDVQLDRATYSATTNSRIVLAVLETGLLKRNQWKVELDVSDATPPAVSRVRVQDDRDAYCVGTFDDRPDGIHLRAFTPTAFANESPPKWGFFFYNSSNKKCREYKGTKLDVYALLERAWYERRNVLLTFDKDLIVDVTIG